MEAARVQFRDLSQLGPGLVQMLYKPVDKYHLKSKKSSVVWKTNCIIFAVLPSKEKGYMKWSQVYSTVKLVLFVWNRQHQILFVQLETRNKFALLNWLKCIFPFFLFPETLSDLWGKISRFERKAAIQFKGRNVQNYARVCAFLNHCLYIYWCTAGWHGEEYLASVILLKGISNNKKYLFWHLRLIFLHAKWRQSAKQWHLKADNLVSYSTRRTGDCVGNTTNHPKSFRITALLSSECESCVISITCTFSFAKPSLLWNYYGIVNRVYIFTTSYFCTTQGRSGTEMNQHLYPSPLSKTFALLTWKASLLPSWQQKPESRKQPAPLTVRAFLEFRMDHVFTKVQSVYEVSNPQKTI